MPRRREESGREASVTMGARGYAPIPVRSMGLNGSLGELPLSDLVEMTAIGGKTGRLTLSGADGAAIGTLAFRHGRVVGAACGELEADKAFYALLAVKEGHFDFDPDAPLDADSCNLPAESLLIEGMRRLDELRRLRSRLPAHATMRLQGGVADDALEARALGYLGPGARAVGDVVDGLLVGGHADEYEALGALSRLVAREVVRLERPGDVPLSAQAGHAPQPELER